MIANASELLLKRVEWTLLKRLDGLLQGDYRTLFRGFGIDLADLREYQYHDDVRHIDWNVTARIGVPHVRQFVEDRDVTAWFIVDQTGSMRFGSHIKRKHEVLLDNIVLLARLLTRHGNRVGLLVYLGQKADGSANLRMLPAGKSRQHVLAMIEFLKAEAPRGSPDADPNISQTRLEVMISQAAGLLKRRSLVFAASDYIDPQGSEGWSRALGHLAVRHEVVALHAQDALEKSIPNLGLVVMNDAETGEQLVVDTSNAAFRNRYQQLAEKREAEIEQALQRARVDRLVVGDAQNLLNFALQRRWQKRRVA